MVARWSAKCSKNWARVQEWQCERNLTEICDHSMWVLILKNISLHCIAALNFLVSVRKIIFSHFYQRPEHYTDKLSATTWNTARIPREWWCFGYFQWIFFSRSLNFLQKSLQNAHLIEFWSNFKYISSAERSYFHLKLNF